MENTWFKDLDAALGEALIEFDKPQAMHLNDFQKFLPLFNIEQFNKCDLDQIRELRSEYNTRVDHTKPLSVVVQDKDGTYKVLFQIDREHVSITLPRDDALKNKFQEHKNMSQSFAHPATVEESFRAYEDTLYTSLSKSDKVLKDIKKANTETHAIMEHFKETFPNSIYKDIKPTSALKSGDDSLDDVEIL
jgi:hypothetical protein